ncbi:MAG: FHA domain-containing protein [Candidatus Methanoculleus thermohydrogenotrophicum]|jgi:DNA-binding transcriptional ArsR family regulator|nr:FHA domain-containing protein [Candidatus Methanoculleus thermohydrogenotrophicum]
MTRSMIFMAGAINYLQFLPVVIDPLLLLTAGYRPASPPRTVHNLHQRVCGNIQQREGREDEDMTNDDVSKTLILDMDGDDLQELSEYLDVLSSSTRLRILKAIERRPKDIRQISSEIETSYENTRKHINKLLSIGVVRKEAGLSRPTARGVRPVWKYSLVPGGLEMITRNLGLFANLKLTLTDAVLAEKLAGVRETFSGEFSGQLPVLILLGGAEDGKVFPLRHETIAIGRVDPDAPGRPDHDDEILLGDDYAAVTRISRPHARLTRRDDTWFIEDCGSTGGTFVNGTQLDRGRRQELHDGDLIELAKGAPGATLVFVVPGEVLPSDAA